MSEEQIVEQMSLEEWTAFKEALKHLVCEHIYREDKTVKCPGSDVLTALAAFNLVESNTEDEDVLKTVNLCYNLLDANAFVVKTHLLNKKFESVTLNL